jgi:hypothetical protein
VREGAFADVRDHLVAILVTLADADGHAAS